MNAFDLQIPIYPNGENQIHDSLQRGLPNVATKPTTCYLHMKSLLETYVRDTPFRQKDLYDLHNAVVSVGDYNVPSYSSSTMRKALKEMRDENLFAVCQKEKQSGESWWWYKPSLNVVPEQSSSSTLDLEATPTEMPSVSETATPVTHDGRVKKFFVDFLMKKLFA